MKAEKKLWVAFFLNFFFSALEFVGGTLTGSVAIVSDSIHDLGDSISIGLSCFLEKISKKAPDGSHTYGYRRYSVLGSVITTVILLFGSAAVIYNAVLRLINPVTIHYNGMILLAIAGSVINFAAAYFTHGDDSLNQKSINLHMLEDVLGWIVVLLGAVIMKFTDWSFVDPLLSIAVALFILVNALKNLKAVLDIFLEKTPAGSNVAEIEQHLLRLNGVLDVHHLHIRSLDGYAQYATLHVVSDQEHAHIKQAVKKELAEHGIAHTTIEMERSDELCTSKTCTPPAGNATHTHTHAHHMH